MTTKRCPGCDEYPQFKHVGEGWAVWCQKGCTVVAGCSNVADAEKRWNDACASWQNEIDDDDLATK